MALFVLNTVFWIAVEESTPVPAALLTAPVGIALTGITDVVTHSFLAICFNYFICRDRTSVSPWL
jgi:hypothetical protein